MRRHCVQVAIALFLLSPSAPLLAQVGPYYATPSEPDGRYELIVRARYDHATRDDFGHPVLLFQLPPRRIEAQQLSTELDLRLSITPRLAMQVVVPIAYRELDVELIDVVVSSDEIVRGARRSLSAFGLLDPTLGAAYRVYVSEAFDAFLDAGARVPLDDNPESNTFPRRIPLGTGQTELFAGAGANLRAASLAASLDYRFSYSPGSTAAYLVRKIGEQNYTNGAVSAYTRHAVRAELALQLSPHWSLTLAPEWSAAEQPSLIERGGQRTFLPEAYRHELELRGGVRLTLQPNHSIELSYAHPLLDAFDKDPFFPIAMPERGLGLAWRIGGL